MMPRPQLTLRALLVAMLVVGAFFCGAAWQRELTIIQATKREEELEKKNRGLMDEVRRLLDVRKEEQKKLRDASGRRGTTKKSSAQE